MNKSKYGKLSIIIILIATLFISAAIAIFGLSKTNGTTGANPSAEISAPEKDASSAIVDGELSADGAISAPENEATPTASYTGIANWDTANTTSGNTITLQTCTLTQHLLVGSGNFSSSAFVLNLVIPTGVTVNMGSYRFVVGRNVNGVNYSTTLNVTGGGTIVAGSNTAFYVGSGGKLNFNGPTIRGGTYKWGSAIEILEGTAVMSGGTITAGQSGSWGSVYAQSGKAFFEMRGGTITGGKGYGVAANGGTVTMSGGTISSNESGGIYVTKNTGTYAGNGKLTMTGGTVTANSSYGVNVSGGATGTISNGTMSNNKYAGLYVGSISTVTMSNGNITGNKSGGVKVGGTFNFNGGSIYSNIGDTAVYVYSTGVLNMQGTSSVYAKIYNNTNGYGGGVYSYGTTTIGNYSQINTNTASSGGGGVYVGDGTTKINAGAQIYGNSAPNGGGVYVGGGTCTLAGGTIGGSDSNKNTATSNGGGVYVVNGATFTMTSGTISYNKATKWAGGVYAGGTFTMSGGTISNNSGTHGGAMFLNGTTTKFAISGGTISANTASVSGGAIYMYANLTLSGGTISGNKATTNGGGICVETGTLTMNNANASIIKNEATNGGGVATVSSGVFHMSAGTIGGSATNKNTAKNAGGGFYQGSTGASSYTGGGISYNTAKNGGGACVGAGSFTEGTAIASGTTANGVIYYNTATEKGGGVYVGAGTYVLNGNGTTLRHNTAVDGGGVYMAGGTFSMGYSWIHTNTATNGGGIYYNGGTMSLATNSYIGYHSGNGTGGHNKATNGAGLYLNANYTLSAGYIQYNDATNNGGGVYVNAGTFTVNNANAHINNNTATSYGGGVYLLNSSKIAMSAGTIAANTATNGGGVAVMGAAQFALSGGTIGGSAANKNTASQYGGGVLIQTSGTCTMSTGITYNQAQNGGGVCVWSGTLTHTLGGITYNTATMNGGGVWINSGATYTINGGTSPGATSVLACTAANAGGGVYNNGGTFNLTSGYIGGASDNAYANKAILGGGVYMNGGTTTIGANGYISRNQATSATATQTTSGGGLQMSGGTLNMNGGAIQYNTATNTGSTTVGTYGGGVHVAGGAFNMNAGVIRGNSVRTNGGGVYVSGTATFKMTSGTIGGSGTGNTANNGAGLFLISTTAATFSGGTISYNTATSWGGGIYACTGSTLNMSGTAIVAYNTAVYGGGIIAASSTTTSAAVKVNISGGQIYGNKTVTTTTDVGGGGIFVYHNSTVTMSGGTIGGPNASYANTSGRGAGVAVSSNGTFTMNGANAAIKYNSATSGYGSGGGVTIFSGTFNFSAGTIANNTAINGGGVHYGTGTFTMTGGTIGGSAAAANTATRDGGGVYMSSGTFIPTGGAISYNKAATSGVYGGGAVAVAGGTFTLNNNDVIITNNSACYGGGVYVIGGKFVMSGGAITSNSATHGGAVAVRAGSFEMSGGVIGGEGNGNTAQSYGAVLIDGTGTGTMSAGTISYNTAHFGGGLCVFSGTFTQTGGEIVHNKGVSGGGVNVQADGTYTLNDGTISDNTASDVAGGVHNGGTFIMAGGEIVNNKATSNGGAVFTGKTFKMTGGEISGNTSISNNCGGVYVGGGTFNMVSGRITENVSARPYGNGVWVRAGELKLGGTAYIYGNTYREVENNVCVVNEGAITFSDTLSDGAKIGISSCITADDFVLTDGFTTAGHVQSDVAKYFVSDVRGLTLKYADNEVVVRYDIELAWNETVQASLDNNGNTELFILYIDWTAENGEFGAGVGFTNTGTILVPNQASILFDFNGKTVNGDNTAQTVMRVAGEIQFDSIVAGVLKGGNGNYGGGLYVDGGTVTFRNGTIAENIASYGGGVYVDNNGTFTMEGGAINANEAERGGGVFVQDGSFNFHGGTIGDSNEGNEATSYGGGLYVAVGGNFIMAQTGDVNCQIIGNTAQRGAGVYVDNGIFSLESGLISNNTATDGGAFYIDGGTVQFNSGSISENTADNGAGLYVVGGTVTIGDIVITDNSANVNGGGVYVAGHGVTMTDGSIHDNEAAGNGGGVYITDPSAEFTLLGGTITANTATDGLGVYINGGTLNVSDNGVITGHESTTAKGAGVYLATGTLNVSGGEISHNKTVNGGGVYVAGGEFTLSGTGKITANEATENGGGMYVAGGVVTVSGGEITDNKAGFGGGAAYLDGGAMTISAGLIGRNQAQGAGGIYVNAGSLRMTGGTIGGSEANKNTARYDAGGVAIVGDGTFTMSGGEISYNTSNRGAGVMVGGTFEMSGGTIKSNSATLGGGVADLGTFTMTNGKITDNTATENGGGVYMLGTNKTYTMSGGEVSDNTAANGAGVYVDGTFTLEGGEIKGNAATTLGGGVYVLAESTFEMTDGTISGNTAQSGAGVYDNGTLTLAGGAISGNNATGATTNYGGGVYVNTDAIMNMTDGAISGNTATYGGGVYVNASNLNFTSGTVSENVASSGGGIYINAGSADIAGGLIIKNTATDAAATAGGGGVFVNNGALTVSGTSKINENVSARYGGGIRIDGTTDNSTVEISSGSLSDNTAAVGGGAYIAGNFAALTLNGSATVSGNEASTNGGGVAAFAGSTVEVAGDAFVTENIAALNGGGVLVSDDGTQLSVSDNGAITKNTATYGGGAYVTALGAFTMLKGSVSVNTATSDGAGVYVNGATLSIEGGSLYGNTANNGGAVYVSANNNGVFTMSGGSIGGDGNAANTAALGGGVYIAGGNVTISSGSITGNTATTNGGGVYLNAGNLSIKDNPVINNNTLQESNSNLYLYNGKTVTVIGKLTDGASIGITGMGKVTDGYTANGNGDDEKAFFFGDMTGAVVVINGGEIYIQISLEDAWNSAVQASLDTNRAVTFVLAETWRADVGGEFGEGVGFTDSGALYLPAGSYIILNLNGYTINRNLGAVALEGSVFYIKGTLEISGTTGSITGGYAENGGGVYVEEGGLFKMTVGTVSGNTATANGGGVYVESGASFELAGGYIRGNTAVNGGAVYVADGGEFTMSSGTIGASAAKNTAENGAGIYSEGITKITGGYISNNEATSNGGGAYVAGGEFIAEGGVIGGASSGAANTAAGGAGVFVADGKFTLDGATIAYNDSSFRGALYVEEGTAIIESGKVSNNTATGGAAGVSVGPKGNLVINGGEITSNTAPAFAGVLVGGIAEMNGGKISGNTATNAGGGVFVATSADAKFTMNGGEITANNATSGSGVYVNGGTFIMNDGKVTGNTATTTGGGVCVNYANVDVDSKFIMNGGEISGNTSENGGGVYVTASSTFEIAGGTISGNKATSNGGGVYNNGGTFAMNGGTIGANISIGTESQNGGGGVYNNGGTFTMTEGLITNNESARDVGGVYIFSGSFEMKNGEISGNTAAMACGGVYILNGTFKMTGGKITANNALGEYNGGGGVLVGVSGTFEMSNGEITSNAASYGGGVFNYGTFNLTGGEISGNFANGNHGGGVYVGQGEFNLMGGKITANKATGLGGGVYVSENGTLNVSGSPIVSGNTANGVESNIYLTADKVIIVTGLLSVNGMIAWLGVTMADPSKRKFTSGFAANNTEYNPELRPETVFFSDDTDYMVSLDSGEAVLTDNDYSQTSLVWQFSKDGGSTWINVETPDYSLKYKNGEEYMVRAMNASGNIVDFDWAQDGDGNEITSTFKGIGSYKFVINSNKYINPSFTFEILPATLIWQYRTDEGNDEEGWLDLTVDSLVYTGATYRIRAVYFNNGIELVQEFSDTMKDVGHYDFAVTDDELYENPILKFSITTRFISVDWDFGDAQGDAADGYYWNYDGLVHSPVAVLNGVSDELAGVDLRYEYARIGGSNYTAAQAYAGTYTLTVGFVTPDKNVVLSNTAVEYKINGVELSLVWTDEEGNLGEEFTFEYNNEPQGVDYILNGVITGDEVKAYVTYSTRTGKVLSGAPTSIGYYTATIRLDDGCYNYVLDKTYTCQIQIVQKTISVDWTPNDDGTYEWTFNGLGQAPTAIVTNPYTGEALNEPYKIEYAPVASDGTEGRFTTTQPVNSGSYVVRITLNNSDSNYVLDEAASKQYFNINKLDVEITWTGATYDEDKGVYFWEYDGDEHILGSEISLIGYGVHKDGRVLDYLEIERLDRTGLTNVGSATATVVLLDNAFNANFNITNPTSQVYEIRKAVITGVTWTDKFKSEYASGDEPQYDFGSISGVNGPAYEAIGVTAGKGAVNLVVTYSRTYAEDWVVDEVLGYTAYARLSAADAANYEFAEGAEYASITFFIMSVGGYKQDIDVTWVVFINEHDYVLYDEYVTNGGFVYNGEVQYPTPIYVKDNGGYEVLAIQPNSVGADAGKYSARIKPSSVYNIKEEDFTCDYVINKLDITVRWQDGQYDSNASFSYVYNGKEQKPFAYVDTTYDFAVEITVKGNVNAGAHTATAAVNGNFNIVEGATQAYTIEKLGLTSGLIVWDFVSAGASGDADNGWYWVYDGDEHAPKATIPAQNWGGDYDIEIIITGSTSEIGNHFAYAVLDSSIPEHNNFKLIDTVSTGFEIVQVKAGQVYWEDASGHTYVDGAAGETGLVFTYNGDPAGQPIKAYFLDGENNKVYLNVAIIGVSAAVEVGTYTAYVTDELDFNSEVPMCNFRIVAMEVTVAWGDTTLTFNGKVQHPEVTLTAGDYELVEGTDYEVTGYVKAGSFTAEIKFINSNYTCTEADATCEFLINKITLTSDDFAWGTDGYDAETDSYIYEYNGEEHGPELTVTYAIDGVDVVFEIGYYGKTAELGKHTVTAYVKSATLDGVEIEDSFILDAKMEYTVKAVPVTVDWDFGELEANDDGVYVWTYDGTSHKPKAYLADAEGNRIKNAAGDDIEVTVYGGEEINARDEAYTATAVLPDGYELLIGAELTQKYLINKATIEVIWDFGELEANGDGVYEWTYGDDVTPKAYEKVTDDDNNVTKGKELTVIGFVKDAGTHTLAVMQSDGNYEFASEEEAKQTYVINPMTVRVVWYGVGGLEGNDTENFEWTYVDNETPIAPTAYLADAEGNLITDENGDYIEVKVSGAGTEIGAHTAQAEDTFVNYDFDASVPENYKQGFTVLAKDLADSNFGWKADGATTSDDGLTFSYEYNGNSNVPEPTADVDGIEFNVEIVKVKDDGTEEPVLAITEVGVYKVTAFSSDGNYRVPDALKTVTVRVIATTVEVEWDESDLIYNGKNQKPNAYYTDVTGNKVPLTVTVEGDSATVGTVYTATATLDSDNYILSGDTATFEIVEKEVKVEWTWEDVVYDATPYAPSSTIAADGENGIFVADKDNVTVVYEITDKDGNVVAGTGEALKKVTDAGEYTIKLWLEGTAAGNYKLDVDEYVFNINKVNLTVKVNDKEVTFGDSLTLTIDDCTFDALVTAEAEDVLNALEAAITDWLTCAYTNSSAPGEYIIYADASWLRKNVLTNYEVTVVNGKLTVKAAEGKLVWQADGTDEDGNPVFTYDGEENLPKAYYYDAQGTRHNLSVSLADESFAAIEGSAINVGTYYAVIVDGNGNVITGDGNYTFENHGVTFKVEKREITVTVKDLNFTYGEVTEENLEELLGLDNGWIYGDVKPVDDIGITLTVEGTCVNGFLSADGDKPATYAIVTGWNETDFNGNYIVRFEGATELTVKPADVTVKDYDGIYAKNEEIYTVYDNDGILESDDGYLSNFIQHTENYLELAGYGGATVTAYFTLVDDRNIAPEDDRYGADAEAITADGVYNFMIKVDNHTTLYGRLNVKVGYADSYVYITVGDKVLEERYGYETSDTLAIWLIENGYVDFDEEVNLRNSGTSKADFLEWVTATVTDENGNEVSGKLSVGTYKVIFGLNDKAKEGLSIYKAAARYVTVVITPYVLEIDWGNEEDNLNFTYDGAAHFPGVTVEGVTLKEGKNVINVNGEEVTVTVTVDGDFTTAGGHSVLVTVESGNFTISEENALRSVTINEPAKEIEVPGSNVTGLENWKLWVIIAAAIVLAAIIIALVIILVKRRKSSDDDGFYDDVEESDL